MFTEEESHQTVNDILGEMSRTLNNSESVSEANISADTNDGGKNFFNIICSMHMLSHSFKMSYTKT